MKLSFDTEFRHQSNYFMEKIWKSLKNGPEHLEESYFNYLGRYISKFGKGWDGDDFSDFLEPKRHTIRKDPRNNWRAGNDIEFIIGKDTPDEFQFAPSVKCLSVQRIHIDHSGLINEAGPAVFIDYQLLDRASLARLAVNDGFATIDDFFLYFDEEFSGNLIHWTSLHYG